MKKLCEEIPCGIWLFTIKHSRSHSHKFAISFYPDVKHSRNIIFSYLLMERIRV